MSPTGAYELSFTVTSYDNLAATVRFLRSVSPLPVAALADAIRSSAAIVIVSDWTACRSGSRRRVVNMLDQLEALGARVQVRLSDEVVSRQFLENQVSLAATTEHHVRMITEFESGEPSEEALEWHRRNLQAGPGIGDED